jgi:catechol 2,3-dioxygenase-like lactoylglutathione lyase family enzyme
MPARRKAATAGLPKAVFVSVAVVVSDRKKALEWYTKKMGLDVIDEMDHWVTVGRKGHAGLLHLCQTSEFDPSIPAEKGNTGILLHLPGRFEESCAQLAANGVKFTSPPQTAEWGSWATVEDPDGNEITVMPAA